MKFISFEVQIAGVVNSLVKWISYNSQGIQKKNEFLMYPICLNHFQLLFATPLTFLQFFPKGNSLMALI